jgi:hypothetical protein
MTPALKSRLSAERLFTAEQLAEAHFWGAYHGAMLAGLESGKAREWALAREAEYLDDALAEVKTHLSSDTTTIRPRKA